MNFSTVFALLACIAVFFGTVLTSTTDVTIFLNGHAFLIVVGGTAAAGLVCFSFKRMFDLFGVFVKRMLGTNRKDYAAIIDDLAALSDARLKGTKAYESAIAAVRDPFLKDAAQVLFWSESEIKRDQLQDLLETRAKTHFKRYLQEADVFRTMARFPPAFGLLGTTLGMIVLLRSLGTAEAKSTIGPSMSIALVATLYGIVLANLVLIPIAENLTKQTHEDLTARQIVVEGTMLIFDGVPTFYVVEKARSFLLPSERGGSSTEHLGDGNRDAS